MPRFCLRAVLLLAILGSGLLPAHGQNPPPWTKPIPRGDITIDLVPVVTPGELTAPVFATHAGDGSGRLFWLDADGAVSDIFEFRLALGHALQRYLLGFGQDETGEVYRIVVRED